MNDENKNMNNEVEEQASCGGNCKCGGSCACGQENDIDEALIDETAQLIDELNTKIGEQERALADAQDKQLRLQAEFDNFRRRTLKEKEELFSRATEEVVCKLLPVVDSFERGLLNGESDAESIVKGMELIHRQFSEILCKIGVENIPACGCEFDPNMHNAVMRVEDSEHPDNTVVEELQKGYTLRGKVIRPSMVKVAAN